MKYVYRYVNRVLGYAYVFEGLGNEVNKPGRTIGYHNDNMHISREEKLIPGKWVYAVTDGCHLSSDISLKGMMNIGMRPTVDGKKRVIEVNIFDFDKTIYGQTLQVHIHFYLRGEVKFNGLDELKQQLAKDKLSALALL